MNQKQEIDKKLLEFISETGLLKRVKRSGWWVLGIKDPETVAEHSFRCAIIGYVIAKIEKANYNKVILMCLFNDIPEARISDLHKMAQRYINLDKTEDKIFNEQIKFLPRAIREELAYLHKEFKKQKTPESIIARDADILECLIQAKEYYEYGFKEANKFMKKAPQHLKTKSAKRLWQLAKSMKLNEWWMRLSEFRR